MMGFVEKRNFNIKLPTEEAGVVWIAASPLAESGVCGQDRSVDLIVYFKRRSNRKLSPIEGFCAASGLGNARDAALSGAHCEGHFSIQIPMRCLFDSGIVLVRLSRETNSFQPVVGWHL